DGYAVIEADGLAAPVDFHSATPEMGLDAPLGVETLRSEQQLLALHPASQEFLGEGWPLVGKPGFFADERELAGETLPPQCVDRLERSLPGADYQDVIDHFGGRG